MKKGVFYPMDMERWERRSHYEYYTKTLSCGYSLTAKLDVTGLLSRVRERGLNFYPAMLYCICAAVNGAREFRMGVDGEGRPGYWDILHPVHTVFHRDDKTFSDIWSEYGEDFPAFYSRVEQDLENCRDKRGIKAKPGQPENFFCVSCVPWLHYEGYSTYAAAGGRPALFPVITFGAYRKEETSGRMELPLTVTISHAAADGYHTSQFFLRLQQILDEINFM